MVGGAEQRRIARDRPQFVRIGDDLLFGQQPPVDLHPLAQLDEVRRRIEAGPPAGSVQDGVEHGRHRSLAIGAGDVDYGIPSLRMVQRFDEHPHPVDAKFHPTRLEAEQVVLNRRIGGEQPDVFHKRPPVEQDRPSASRFCDCEPVDLSSSRLQRPSEKSRRNRKGADLLRPIRRARPLAWRQSPTGEIAGHRPALLLHAASPSATASDRIFRPRPFLQVQRL